MHLEGTEFLSIWKAAHLWVGQDPDASDPQALPQPVKDYIHLLIVGYLRGDLDLRGKWLRHNSNEQNPLILFFAEIPLMLKLRKCQYKDIFDKELLDSLGIARGEVLRWCEKEYRSYPPFWLPEGLED